MTNSSSRKSFQIKNLFVSSRNSSKKQKETNKSCGFLKYDKHKLSHILNNINHSTSPFFYTTEIIAQMNDNFMPSTPIVSSKKDNFNINRAPSTFVNCNKYIFKLLNQESIKNQYNTIEKSEKYFVKLREYFDKLKKKEQSALLNIFSMLRPKELNKDQDFSIHINNAIQKSPQEIKNIIYKINRNLWQLLSNTFKKIVNSHEVDNFDRLSALLNNKK